MDTTKGQVFILLYSINEHLPLTVAKVFGNVIVRILTNRLVGLV